MPKKRDFVEKCVDMCIKDSLFVYFKQKRMFHVKHYQYYVSYETYEAAQIRIMILFLYEAEGFITQRHR